MVHHAAYGHAPICAQGGKSIRSNRFRRLSAFKHLGLHRRALRKSGMGRAGAQAGDVNPVRFQLGVQGIREGQYVAFSGRIDREVRQRLKGRGRRHEQQSATLALHHARNERAGQVGEVYHVQELHLAHPRRVLRVKRPRETKPRIRDVDVHLVPILAQAFHQAGYGAGGCEIGRVDRYGCALRSQGCGKGLKTVCGPCGEEQFRALYSKLARHGLANPAGCARHEDRCVTIVVHSGTFVNPTYACLALMLLPAELIARAAAVLREHAVEDAGRVARWLFEDAVSGQALSRYSHTPVPAAIEQRVMAMVARCATGEPLAYVLGHAPFRALSLKVNPSVLIPRPETEELVDRALAVLPVDVPCAVLDAGTGSGCIALGIQAERPLAHVMGVDVSEDALAVARENGARTGLEVDWLHGNLLAPHTLPTISLDLLVSNPPYIPLSERASLDATVREFEPAFALFCEDDPLLFYRALEAYGAAVLKAAGHVLLETHTDYADAVADLFRGPKWETARVYPDLFGNPRAVCVQRSKSG